MDGPTLVQTGIRFLSSFGIGQADRDGPSYLGGGASKQTDLDGPHRQAGWGGRWRHEAQSSSVQRAGQAERQR